MTRFEALYDRLEVPRIDAWWFVVESMAGAHEEFDSILNKAKGLVDLGTPYLEDTLFPEFGIRRDSIKKSWDNFSEEEKKDLEFLRGIFEKNHCGRARRHFRYNLQGISRISCDLRAIDSHDEASVEYCKDNKIAFDEFVLTLSEHPFYKALVRNDYLPLNTTRSGSMPLGRFVDLAMANGAYFNVEIPERAKGDLVKYSYRDHDQGNLKQFLNNGYSLCKYSDAPFCTVFRHQNEIQREEL